MKLTPVFFDAETFWSTTHTLSRMTNVEYVTHPDTEIISIAIKIKNGPTEVIFGESQIAAKLASIDWSDKILIGHNMSEFDSLIASWRFGVKPAMWGCTAAMARSKYAKTSHHGRIGVSLAKLVGELGIGVKDNTALISTRGKHLKDFTPAEIEAMREYNKADTEQCAQLFAKLNKITLPKELWHIHATTCMLVEPKFTLDTGILKQALEEEKQAKLDSMKKLADLLESPQEQVARRLLDGTTTEEWVSATLMSTAKFSEVLQKRGVDVPMKPSPSNPQKQVPALAKTDEAFLTLTEHPDEVVAAAARARLRVKSTLMETRTTTMLAVAGVCRNLLPIPLAYCGADTTGRWSGRVYNPQNLPRIPRDKEGRIVRKITNALRLSMCAPAGYKVVVSDLSGIELRVNHFLWKVQESMDMYRQDPQADLYRAFAAVRYGVEALEVTKDQRHLAKIAQLGLGFGSGYTTFQKVAKIMGGLTITEDESREIVDAWRYKYNDIVTGWRTCHDSLRDIMYGREREIDPWGLCHTTSEGIRLPSGRTIYYPHLRFKPDDNGRQEFWYGAGSAAARIYAGKVDENIVQALARDVIADVAYKVFKQCGEKPSLTVHDELVYVVKEDQAEPLLALLDSIMRTPPDWWPELVTWSEGDIADSYGLAK